MTDLLREVRHDLIEEGHAVPIAGQRKVVRVRYAALQLVGDQHAGGDGAREGAGCIGRGGAAWAEQGQVGERGGPGAGGHDLGRLALRPR